MWPLGWVLLHCQKQRSVVPAVSCSCSWSEVQGARLQPCPLPATQPQTPQPADRPPSPSRVAGGECKKDAAPRRWWRCKSGVQGRRPGSSGLLLSSDDKNPFAHAGVRRSPTQTTEGCARVTHLREHPCGASAPASRRHRRHHRIATAITDSNRRLRVLRRRAVILKSEDSHRRAMW